MLRTAQELKSYAIHATDGDLGSIAGFYIGGGQWRLRYLAANTGGWLLGRRVLLAPESVEAVDAAQHIIAVRLTKAQIENSPPIPLDQPVSAESENAMLGYFGWTDWWGSPPLIPATPIPAPPLPEGPETVSPPETALTSIHDTGELTGFDISTGEEDFGKVNDVLIDDETWTVRYLVVDIGHFWAGRMVIIPVDRAGFVRWLDRKLPVSLTRQQLENLPEYDATA